MEIRHLITFQTIVDKGSYTGAAAKLGYTQSTITTHIQELEQEIGGALFTYEKRRLKLTPLGRELIPLAEDLLSAHDKIKNMQSIHEIKGVLKIAAPESLTISRLGPIIREYSMKYPNVSIILSNGTCGQNQVELLSGRVDIAFMVYPEIQIEKCIHHSLLEERIVLVAGSDAPDHFDDYQQSGKNFFITNEEGCSYRTMFERFLVKHDISHLQIMELWSIEAIKQTVMSGIGFSVLPYITVKEEVKAGKLKILQQSEPFERLYSHMLVKKKKWQLPAAEAFVSLVLESFGDK
ncbi:LysR family transcriptional regulator [Bacillus siamensis]|uniref:LysR family transcriptional regulator n=1 Tax=Bacillus siamensis TaxID=659243 RepID=UPI003F674042